MKELGPLTDRVASEKPLNRIQRFLVSYIRDPRDLPFVDLVLKITLTMIPLAVLLYIPGVNPWIWASAAVGYHILNNFVFKGPFGLMLHCTCHRLLFRKEVNILNQYIPWVLAPFFGHSPETYYTHHIGMHHAENNMLEDESSTMPFQRDSLRDFGKYFVSFLFAGVYHLAMYFSKKKRKQLLYRSVRGELLFIGFCIVMCFVNWQATLVVFILPFVIFRLIAMMGNWAQHAFVNPDCPDNPYGNSITCINTKYNHLCWNDGYHISHHLRPTMHWTEHPGYFLKTVDDYAKNEAIVFDGIHFLHVYVWLMTKRYDLMARHFVNLDGRFKSDEEIVTFLKRRTQKFELQPLAAQARA